MLISPMEAWHSMPTRPAMALSGGAYCHTAGSNACACYGRDRAGWKGSATLGQVKSLHRETCGWACGVVRPTRPHPKPAVRAMSKPAAR
jgi:hypothetical protein